MRTSTYHATRDGDTKFSDPTFACRYCGRQGLAWGPNGAYRRLFEPGRVLHNCLPPKRQVCHCEGFGDLQIPVEFYDSMEYRPWEK